MKHMEQLDAHVQSYRNEQKRKERDRIRGIFQYLEKKRKQLSLQEKPVRKIQYNIKNLTPPQCAEFSIKRFTVENKVKSNKEQGIQPNAYSNLMFSSPQVPMPQTVDAVIPNFSIDKYNFKPSEIVLDEIQDAVISNGTVSFEFKGTSISLSTFHDITMRHNQELNFKPPIQIPLNLKQHSQITVQHDFKSEFVVSDITLSVSPLQATSINMEQADYKIEELNVRLDSYSIHSPTSFQFQIDFQKQLIKNDIKLNSVVIDFDFSDVLKKLRKVLTDDQN